MELCRLCPRACGADRAAGKTGFCGAGARPRVFRWGPHFGEEPPLVGEHGSGCVFFSRCTMKCLYCQNSPWSWKGEGDDISVARLTEIFRELAVKDRCSNWNLVSPTPYLPFIRKAVAPLLAEGIRLPFVWNSSGYESVETLDRYSDLCDTALFDLRYSRNATALSASAAPNYVEAARAAIRWAFSRPFPPADSSRPQTDHPAPTERAPADSRRLPTDRNHAPTERAPADCSRPQTDHLTPTERAPADDAQHQTNRPAPTERAPVDDAQHQTNHPAPTERAIASGGGAPSLIVRILVLPGHADEAIENLAWLATELSPSVHVSLMSQYAPAFQATEIPPYNRVVTEEEYAEVTEAAADFGFDRGWIQGFGSRDASSDLVGENMSPGEGTVGAS